MNNNILDIPVYSESIALDKFLKWAGVAETGGHAKELIHDGQVLVNDTTETKRSRRLSDGDVVVVLGSRLRVRITKNI